MRREDWTKALAVNVRSRVAAGREGPTATESVRELTRDKL
jgi:hypothetical protein